MHFSQDRIKRLSELAVRIEVCKRMFVQLTFPNLLKFLDKFHRNCLASTAILTPFVLILKWLESAFRRKSRWRLSQQKWECRSV